MGDHGLELAGFEVLDEHVDRPSGYANMLNDPPSLVAQQRLHRTAPTHRLFKAGMLRVVEEDQLQVVHAQQVQTALDAPRDGRTVEGTAARVSPYLGLE